MNFARETQAAGALVLRASSAQTKRVGCDWRASLSIHLGGFTWTQLARALRVQELTPGAIARAHTLFDVTSAPWCPEIFKLIERIRVDPCWIADRRRKSAIGASS